MRDQTKRLSGGSVLDEDALKLLAETQTSGRLSADRLVRMRTRLLQAVRKEARGTYRDFHTIRSDDGIWTEVAPKMEMKVLHVEKDAGIQSYLLRLHPGFEHPGHDHPLDEECLMLEGEMTIGSIRLRAGDYHLAPKGTPHGFTRSETGALVFIRGALPDLAA